MEVSPLLAADTAGSIAAARQIHRDARRDNLFVKIPGTPEGVAAIEESIFAGIPINVTLLFSREQYLAAAEAYAATANGIIPWRERPQCFRKGVISRIPPLSFRPEEQGL